MPSLFFVFIRILSLASVYPLASKFDGCHSLADISSVFSKFSSLEQTGILTIAFVLLVTMFELAGAASVVASKIFQYAKRVAHHALKMLSNKSSAKKD